MERRVYTSCGFRDLYLGEPVQPEPSKQVGMATSHLTLSKSDMFFVRDT